MKVSQTNVTPQRTTAEIDLFDDIEVPRSARARVKQEVGEFLVEQINLNLANQTSPVTGRSFKKLSKEYAALKQEEFGSAEANLEATGDMKDSISFKQTGSGIELGVFGPDAPKADGHNNLSGESRLPRRQFIPGEGQNFVSDIKDRVREIILNVISEEVKITRDDLDGIESQTELYSFFQKSFPGASKSEIRQAIISNADLFDLVTELELDKLL